MLDSSKLAIISNLSKVFAPEDLPIWIISSTAFGLLSKLRAIYSESFRDLARICFEGSIKYLKYFGKPELVGKGKDRGLYCPF